MAVSEEKQAQKRSGKQTDTAVSKEKNGHENGQKPSNLKENTEGKIQKTSDLTENDDDKKLQKGQG